MNVMPFVSIIIPVYKVEQYLRQCVDSILGQRLESFEIILVDDGSPDGSGKICDEYAEKDSRIRVIHKENGGLSSARNAGIDASLGEYIIFLDSDDWWNPEVSVNDMLNFVKESPSTDMFLFSSLDYVEGEGYFKRAEHERLGDICTDTVADYYRGLLANGNLEVHAATKVLRASFIKENKLYYKPGIKGEDNEWIIRALRALGSVKILPGVFLYVYRAGRADSISNSIRTDNITDLLDIVSRAVEYRRENGNPDGLMEYELCFCSYLWFSALGLTGRLSGADKKLLFPLFKRTASVCKYSNSKKTKMAYRLYRMTGLRFTAWALGKYISRKQKRNLNKSKVSK